MQQIFWVFKNYLNVSDSRQIFECQFKHYSHLHQKHFLKLLHNFVGIKIDKNVKLLILCLTYT